MSSEREVKPPEASASLAPIPEEHAGSNACAVGFISRRDNIPTHAVVEKALYAKIITAHRAGYAVDGKTSDGDGIETQVPQKFFGDRYNELGGPQLGDRSIAVGQVWLPRNEDMRARAIEIINQQLAHAGYHDFKWREENVTDVNYMGPQGRERMPHFAQILIPQASRDSLDPAKSEEAFTFVREEIMNRLRSEGLIGRDPETCHFSSLSGERIIYAARSHPEDGGKFFPDLQHPGFVSVWAKIHSRFTTAGDTKIANIQPLPGGVAHNGTIVTDRGAANAMKIHERRIAAALGPRAQTMLPLMQAGASDSANLSRVKEALEHTGLSQAAIKMLLLAKAESDGLNDSPDVKKTKKFTDAAMEKYDGPALVIMTNGRKILATLDANGLRPAMIEETDEYFALGSEFGMWGFDIQNELKATDELDRGCMLEMDTVTGQIKYDTELQEEVARDFPFKDWSVYVEDFEFNAERALFEREYNDADLARRMRLAGYSKEDTTKKIQPMIRDGKEATGSMGNQSRHAAFSDIFNPATNFYPEAHVQIVAPPHDSELDRDVMNLHGYTAYPLDSEGNPRHILRVPNRYVLSRDMLKQFREKEGEEKFKIIDCTYNPNDGPGAYRAALDRVADESVEAARKGQHVILTDEYVGPDKAPMMMTHATGKAHNALLDSGLRGDVSLLVEDAYVHTSHEAKILKECGANFVMPYLAEEYVINLAQAGKIRGKDGKKLDMTPAEAVGKFLHALDEGIYVAQQRTGTMRASSSQGAHQFSVFGMSKRLIDEIHPGVASPISGIDEEEIQRRISKHHQQTYRPKLAELSIVTASDGLVQLARGGRIGRNDPAGEIHAQDAASIEMLQNAVRSDDPEVSKANYRAYSHYVHALGLHHGIYTRDHMALRYHDKPLPISEIESVDKLYKRIFGGAMSVGSIHEEVHKDIHAPINSLPRDPDTGEGAQSNSGEGGYPRELIGTIYQPQVIQWSTAAFGITPELLASADVIEFKFGQGAKTGQGGKLDGKKVNTPIAKNRFVEKGTTLNSPPQHADMLSIEDLKQKIKKALSINPTAEIRIKIVAKDGCEHDAVGAAKAMQNAVNELKDKIPNISGRMSILLAGHAGGTGNAPINSILHSGEPWEVHLPRVSKALHDNRFRENVKLLVDGGMRTGKDIVYAAAHGADAVGFGTTFLYTLGCLNQGQCQTGDCAAAVATTNEELIEEFYMGEPEHTDRYARLMVEELQEEMARLHIRTYDELIGADILQDISKPNLGLDMSFIKDANLEGLRPRYKYRPPLQTPVTAPSIDAQIVAQAPEILRGGKGEFNFVADNRAVATGTYIAGRRALYQLQQWKEKGDAYVPEDDSVVLNIHGNPGYATSALLVKSMTLNVKGIAGDSLGANNNGGIVTVVAPKDSLLAQNGKSNILAGNLANAYSTAGKGYVAGLVGHGASFRQSGGDHVYHGTKARAAQFKTGGTFTAWKTGVGRNSFAKHSGGESFVRDENSSPDAILDNISPVAYNDNFVRSLADDPAAAERLRVILTDDYARTQDPELSSLLERFHEVVGEFVHIIPKKKATAASAESAAEVVATPEAGR